MNKFGHEGGFDQILSTLEKQQDDDHELNIISILMECVSKPYLIYHSQF